jgi:tight adherence protein C
MPTELTVAVGALFVMVAVIVGTIVSMVLERTSPERRRLNELLEGAAAGAGGAVIGSAPLSNAPGASYERYARYIPKSPKDMGRLRRRLTQAGYKSPTAAIVFSVLEIVLPVIGFLAVVWWQGLNRGWMLALLAAMGGYLIPGLWLSRRIEARKKQIRNGLPDALDLFIVCVESGSSLDQAILKASEELQISYPYLADELRMIVTEVRAGKPRLEAFKNFADRTRVDDVRALVAMMVQTDRFGTSIAQALRTHAETARTKRRQAAEEKAGKLGVKLVFPLVFCLFPAFYVVTLGPAVIQFLRVFIEGVAAN